MFHEETTSAAALNNENERRAKKQKTSQAVSEAASPKNVIRLTVSPSNQYAIAVTDDKCVRVFSVESNGELRELSARHMPKRPCAVQVLPDNATILCGDKFGDVYSLPLLPETKLYVEEFDMSPDATVESEPRKDETKLFKPSATNKTVHTQRNLKSLAAQQNQKNLTPKTKEPLKFEHKLLLGHVSMLTDLTHATREVDGKPRGYIITADRDEHIRVSRAPPQSHVIEGYCLGHKEFVSKVCLIPGTDLLVSGGGDGWIGVWDWPEFRLRHRLYLSHTLAEESIAVSGIWIVPAESGDVVVVACEKTQALCYVPVRELTKESHVGKMLAFDRFDCPILDFASIGNTIFASLDAREEGQKRLRTVELGAMKLYEMPTLQMERANAFKGSVVHEKGLDDLLYGMENLRKRGHHEEAEDV